VLGGQALSHATWTTHPDTQENVAIQPARTTSTRRSSSWDSAYVSNTNENEDWAPILRSVEVALTSGSRNFHEKGLRRGNGEVASREVAPLPGVPPWAG